MTFRGVIGTSIVKIFDLTVASTGLNSRQLKDAKIPFDSVTVFSNNHAEYYPRGGFSDPVQASLWSRRSNLWRPGSRSGRGLTSGSMSSLPRSTANDRL